MSFSFSTAVLNRIRLVSDVYFDDVFYEGAGPYVAEYGTILKLIPKDEAMAPDPTGFYLIMNPGKQEFYFDVVGREASLLVDIEFLNKSVFNMVSGVIPYVPSEPAPEPEKALFVMPASSTLTIEEEAVIFVDDVLKTGDVTVPIDSVLKLQANEGLEFITAILIFTDEKSINGYQELEMTIAPDKLSASIENNMLSSEWEYNSVLLMTTAIAEPEPEPDPIPSNVEWLITQPIIDSVHAANSIIRYDGIRMIKPFIGAATKTIEIVPNDGFIFGSASSAKAIYSGVFGTEEKTFTIASESSATLRLDGVFLSNTTLTGISIVNEAYVEPTPSDYIHTFTQSDMNKLGTSANIYLEGKLKLEPFSAKAGQTVEIRTISTMHVRSALLAFQKGSYIDGQLIIQAVDYPFEKVSDSVLRLVIGDYSDNDMYLGLNLLLQTIEVPFTITISQDDIDNAALNKASIFDGGEMLTEPKTFVIGEEIKLVANEGWEFYERQGPDSVRLEFNDPIFGGYLYESFAITPMGKEATYTVKQIDAVGYVYKGLLVQTKQSNTDISGTNNVYLADDSTIRNINNERYRTRVVEYNGKTEIEFFDYGDFILNIIDLPFDVSGNTIEDESIHLGDRTLISKAPVINTDKITLDMGEISITGDGDSLDYQNVKTILHLPWLSKILIDPSYVINQTIKIEYHVDMYTGDTVANIYSTAVDNGLKTFMTTSGSIGTNIPFAGYKFYINTPDNKGINTSTNNNLSKAYIEVVKSDAPLRDEFFNASVSDAGVLTNESGYLEISNANLQFKALHTEKLDIINILRNGIIV